MGNIDSPFSAVIVLNILLLEDRDEDALMVERALKDTGYIYSLKRARNKAEFIAQLDAGFDLILADYHLADCNALEALRQLEERNLDIPLILVSGVAREEEANEAIRHGAADYLSRDRLSRLGPAIAAAFEHKALRVEADDVERALERSREEFDHAFDNAAIGIALTSLDGRWLKVNQALCRVTGYAEPELLATDCHSVTHVDDVAGDIDLMRRLVGGEVGSTQREKRYIHKLGHPVWVQVTASLVRGRDGAARYRMLQVLDITHRKEAEERFQATFNQAAVGIAHTTTEGAILEANRKLCDMLGFTAQELMRLTTRELTFAEDRDKQDSLRRQVIAGQLPHFQAEKRFVCKNGQVIWVNRTVTLARHAASGEPYLIQVFEDITERRRTEERLERANRARRVLAECNHAQAHATDESAMLREMCRIIVESGGYKQGWIGFATGEPTRPLRPVAQAGYAGDEPFPSPENLTANGTYRGVAAEALACGAPVVAKDILNDPRHEWRRARALRHGFQSSIGLPLKAEDSVLGVLVMHASEPDAFDDEEIALLTTLSEDIAFGIGSSRAAAARRQAEANLKRLVRARRVMAECSHIVVHATDEMEMLESMCRVVVESGGYRQSWIGLPTRDSMRPVYPVADSGFGSDAPMTAPVTWTSGSYHGLAAEALAAGETRIARDILNDPQHERKRDRARQLGYQCSIALPLKGEKEVLGVIVIHASEPEAFDSDEIALLMELSDDIAYAIVGLRTRVARRNAEKALRESEERFRVLTELSSDWSWEQDADYRFTSLSRTVKSHAGISAEDHVGRARWELPRTTPVNTTWDEHKAVLAARQLFHDLLLRRVLEDGSENYVLVSGQPVFDASGKFKGYRGVAKNITDKIRAEMALRESERRFREMFDQAAVGITRVQLDGILVDVNQKFCDMLGYARDELLGRHIREITHPDDYAQGLQYRERVTHGTAKSVTGEKRFVRKDGTILWARRTMSAACDDAGNPQYVISVVEDITERKEAEERYWATFEHAPVGIMHTDMDNDRILHANPKLREMLGYTHQELISLTTDQILHPDHVGRDRPKYREKLLKGELDSFSSERLFVRKDGSPVWVNRTVSLVRDAAGKPQYFIRIVEDISERKQAELELQRKTELAQLLESLARAANEAASPEAAMRSSLEQISEHGRWALGRLGIYGPGEDERFPERSLWHARDSTRYEPFIRASLDSKYFAPGGRFISVVLEQKRPVWLADISSSAGFGRMEIGLACGLRSAFAFPIIVGGEVAAFLEFFATEPREPDSLMLEAVASVGAQLARLIERGRAMAAAAQLAAIVESSQDAMVSAALDSTILTWNAGAERLFGYFAAEAMGRNVSILVPEDRRHEVGPIKAGVLAGQQVGPHDTERLAKDGRRVQVSVSASPLRDSGNNVTGFALIYRDIADRKRSEEAIARERALLRTIIDTLPDYIYVKDRAGRFRLANEAWLKARRITAEDIADKTVFDMFPREVAERMAAQDEAIVKTGAPLLDFEQLIIVKTPDGEQSKTQWASTTKVPMRDSSGDIIGTVGISRDITEHRLSTRRRTMEHGVTRVLADSATLNEALPAILQNICEALGWACGAYWRWDEKAQILRCVETWHVDGEEVAAFSAFSKQAVNEAPAWRDGAPKTESGGLVRGVWFSGAPVWLPDVAQQPGFRRGPMAAKAGLHCAFGFPVLAGSRPLGVMEFYGRDIKQPDDALLQIVRSIGSQIGQFDQRKQAEAAQRASEATLSATFEQAGVGMALRGIDPRNPRWLRVNQKLCDILGYTREELLQLSSVDVTPPEERRLAIDYNERLLRGEVASYSREKRYVRKDGQIIWATISLSAVRGPDGAPTHVISVIQDITDRKRAEAALQESEEHLRGMFAHASVGITVSALDLHYIDVNDKYCDIVGYSREELLKMSVRDVNVSENLASMEEHRRKLFAGEIESMVREKPLLRKDGSQVWVSMVTSVIRDHNGGPKHFISVIQDVSQRKRAEEALRESEEQFRQLAGNIPQVFWITDVERKQTIYVSSAAEKLIGRPLEEIQANPRMLIRAVHKADRPRLNAARKAAAEGGYEVTYRIVRPGGAIRWVHDRAFPVHDTDGNVYRIAGITEDITERRRADEALQESEEQFRQLANNIPQVFWITDAEQKDLVYLSPAYEVVSGQSIEQVKPDPRKWLEIVHQDDRDRVAQARKRAADAQYDEMFRIVRPDGSIRWMRDRAFPVRDAEGFVYRIAGIAEDITERKAAEERLMHLAHYDVLTSLPNRVLFYDRLRQALAQAKRNQWIVGVMFIDVDRFKNVNDTLGHAVGDRLLQQISDRLARSVRSGDTVGRLGGDEFAIVLSNLSSAQDANLVAQKMMASFNEPFKLEGAELYMTASIGITLYPDDSTDQDTLIKNADTAMYRSKEVGRNSYQFYTPEMNARALQVLGMESSLRRALERNEFLVYYQPKAGIADGDITGVEALLRWRHPERGLVSPGEFMPVLEETGLIVPVGEWVLKAVCSQIKAWELAGITPLPVAVNLSARQFSSKDLGASIKRIIEEHRVDPGLIELELTESSLMTNTEEAVRTLEYLSSLGVSLAIDDFGTGYSSLGYLKRFPLDALKVDRSFVRDITTDGDDATITRAVISMAHSLGLKVVAEGVETESQLAFLAEYGCDQIQGYYFSPPVAAEECGTWLKEKRCLRRPVGVADSGSPVVLLVDDDDDALTLVKRVLAKDGYRILAARNAQEGLALLRDHRVDVVISDQNMPGTPGVEFLQRVKALSPRTMRMMTSGYADFQTMADAVNKGEIFRFLPKNISGEALRADVREALRARAEAVSNNGHYVVPGTAGK